MEVKIKINKVLGIGFKGLLIGLLACNNSNSKGTEGGNVQSGSISDSVSTQASTVRNKPFSSRADTVNPYSFLGIHQNILSDDCGMAGCHDGAFEPDFRTIESAYNTLVWHPIIKNNQAGSFKFRVIPFDTAHSVMYERITNCCFVNKDDRMPQQDIGIPLSDEKIAAIGKWIIEGAKNSYGEIPVQYIEGNTNQKRDKNE